MNVETGHLVSDINDVDETLRDQYERLQGKLAIAAEKELAGRSETVVDVKRGKSPLAKWARKRRRDKKRARAAIAKASRRRNRSS